MIKDADKCKVSISILGQPANTSLPSPVQDLGLEEDGGGYTLARSQEVRLQRGNRMMMPDAGPASAWVESKPRDLRRGGHLCQG